jgi:hypothetical protein
VVTLKTEFNLAQPKYTLTFTYTPPAPELEAHRPPGILPFGGVYIWYMHFVNGVRIPAMEHPYVPTSSKVAQAQPWTSIEYDAYKDSFRVYFVSMNVGGAWNAIVDGITPSVDITIDPKPAAPKVTHLQIVDGGIIYLLDGSFIEEATFSWTPPTADAGLARYAGVALYRVATTGAASVPTLIVPQTGPTDIQVTVAVHDVPAARETWTIAAISVDVNGQLGDDPNTYGSQSWTSPVATWTVGPPGIGVLGSGIEYAPLVTVNAGATAVPTESTSSDGIRMVTFAINGTNGAWSPPSPPDNRFGGVWVALVESTGVYDTSHPILWQVPQGDNKFTTPAIPAPGAFNGPGIQLGFFLLSRDPQGHRNTLQVGKTPVIVIQSYTPTEGTIIPSRNPLTPQWFSGEFFWPADTNMFSVSSIGAGKIQVGSLLQVGGKNSFSTTAQNGQIGVFDNKNNMVGWIGMAQVDTGVKPQNNVGANNYGGAWFGQLWVGSDSPAHAPLYVDQNGVINVGGIAAAANAPYPYISVRDNYGIEHGRIGAMLTNPAPPGDSGAIPSTSLPPQLTSGAWFTQFAAGGVNSANWQVFIDGSTAPGKFYIRDTDTFSINFASGPFASNPYIIDMGKSVWAGVGSQNNSAQFPGIRIYDASGAPPQQIFGSILLNRGLMLRGRPEQSNEVLVSLAMVNGDTNGGIYPVQFWGQLAMYNPWSPSQMTVDIASGHYANGVVYGDSHLYLSNSSGLYTFTVDEGGQVHFRGRLYQGWGPGKELVDDNGNWVGGFAGGLVTSITASGPGISTVPSPGTGAVTIYNNGVTSISAGTGISVSSSTNAVSVSLNFSASVSFAGYSGGLFSGSGVQTGGEVRGGALTTGGQITGEALAINPSGTTDAFTVSGKKCCDYNGTWSGNGLQANAGVLASQFGIFNVAWGVSGSFVVGTKTITVNGGIITGIA